MNHCGIKEYYTILLYFFTILLCSLLFIGIYGFLYSINFAIILYPMLTDFCETLKPIKRFLGHRPKGFNILPTNIKPINFKLIKLHQK